MKTYRNLYSQVCSPENLLSAFQKARKGKTFLHYVLAFEQNLGGNLALLRTELLLHSYRPLPLQTFILRDPKTRKISVSAFRDRIVHHAICNVIEPLFDKTFIFDSFANRRGKGTLSAIKRLQYFINKVSHNKTILLKWSSENKVRGFFFKGDIKKYFDTINHKKLMEILHSKIKDKKLLFLIATILDNHQSFSHQFQGNQSNIHKPNTHQSNCCGQELINGLPLGNLTSQFFANVYLNELDQFVKQRLKVKYYVRYVDDFVMVHNNQKTLQSYKEEIRLFISNSLLLTLHPDKSIIKPFSRGISFLGFRVFPHYLLLKKKAVKQFQRKLTELENSFLAIMIDYDVVYNFLEGWLAYAKQANTYKLRRRVHSQIEGKFPGNVSTKEINRSSISNTFTSTTLIFP